MANAVGKHVGATAVHDADDMPDLLGAAAGCMLAATFRKECPKLLHYFAHSIGQARR